MLALTYNTDIHILNFKKLMELTRQLNRMSRCLKVGKSKSRKSARTFLEWVAEEGTELSPEEWADI